MLHSHKEAVCRHEIPESSNGELFVTKLLC